MSRASGIISSVITLGLIGLLIYYCCLRSRRRRNAGNTVLVTTIPQPPPPVFPGSNNPPSEYPSYPPSQGVGFQPYPTPMQHPNNPQYYTQHGGIYGPPATTQQPGYPMPMPQTAYEPHSQSANNYSNNSATAPPFHSPNSTFDYNGGNPHFQFPDAPPSYSQAVSSPAMGPTK